ncbi:DUF5676 family membrane protein [Geopsychrobacter electrodiphilus]|uniref:DUF5676 family membrane protein n=1 Tax=Geopsychrobacter electrodiphilus TaxID=225196 RepID=UPI00037946B4|nr:DUF5676 family membrane protein [Geopsychrobacter electrodiphilus]
MGYLNWKTVGVSVGLFLAVSYLLCVIYDLILPGQNMYLAWSRLLPGFKWLTWGTFFLGLIESFLYGVYFSLVFVPLYNFCKKKFE